MAGLESLLYGANRIGHLIILLMPGLFLRISTGVVWLVSGSWDPYDANDLDEKGVRLKIHTSGSGDEGLFFWKGKLGVLHLE